MLQKDDGTVAKRHRRRRCVDRKSSLSCIIVIIVSIDNIVNILIPATIIRIVINIVAIIRIVLVTTIKYYYLENIVIMTKDNNSCHTSRNIAMSNSDNGNDNNGSNSQSLDAPNPPGKPLWS